MQMFSLAQDGEKSGIIIQFHFSFIFSSFPLFSYLLFLLHHYRGLEKEACFCRYSKLYLVVCAIFFGFLFQDVDFSRVETCLENDVAHCIRTVFVGRSYNLKINAFLKVGRQPSCSFVLRQYRHGCL